MNLSKITGRLIAVLQVGCLVGCSVQAEDASSPLPPPEQKRLKQSWQHANEQEWIVDCIGRDVAEMLVYAKFRNDASTKLTPDSVAFKTTTVDAKANKYRFDVRLPNSSTPLVYDLTLTGYAWDPLAYRPFAQKLLETLQLKADAPSAVPVAFLRTLADANRETLYAENKRIATEFTKAPLDASLHQQAALLQATLDMLELAGNFSDTRAPLNRICAHLAIAQSLSEKPDLNLVGKIADVALESMSCRDGIAVVKNDALAKGQTDPTVKSWLRALKIRSTSDYRLFDEKNQTPIEASQFGMRFATSSTSEKAFAYVKKHNCTPELRWMRIVMAGGSSVETGHQIDAQIFPMEQEDFSADYKAFNNDTIKSQTQAIDELNKPSTRCLQVVNGESRLMPLSWGDLAEYHARHIAWAADREYRFNLRSYGVEEDAVATLAKVEKALKGARVLPLVYMDVPVDQKQQINDQRFFFGMDNLLAEHPETITSYEWLQTRDRAQSGKPPYEVRFAPESWFSPPMPLGTAFYFGHRTGLKTFKPDLAELTQLRVLCPLYPPICAAWAKKKFGEHPTGDQLRVAYGSLAEFNLDVMKEVAEGDYAFPDKYVSEMEKLASLSPDYYIPLADYCVRHNQLEKAAHFYQVGIDTADDSVYASNNSTWLALYYFDHNEKQKALDVAKAAAEVYSQGGLHCLAQLYERMGELQKAEQIYRDSKERYPRDEAFTGFYLRNKDKSKDYAAKAEPFIKQAFPAGIQTVHVADLKAPPTVGLQITSANPLQSYLGLNKGNIVVALNDCKIDNKEQYGVIRQMAVNPQMKCMVWDGNKYKEVLAQTVRNGMIGFTFEDYTAQK